MAKKLQPKLRFKGFTDDWEQQKLGNLGQARSGVGFPIQEQGGKSGIPFFKVSDMNTIGNESEMRHANNYVDISQIQKNGWILITDVPAILFAKVGAAVLLNRKRLVLEPFLLDNNMMEYSISGKAWDVPFAQALFETINLPSLVQTGALPSYNTSDIKSIEVSLPSNTLEQKRIGSFFSSLNKLIAAEQRKLNLLDKYKDALLGALFPEVGEDRPKKRFKGFALPWETQSFSQVFDFLQNNTLSRAELHTDTGIAKVIHYGDILTKLNTCLDVENTNLPYTNDLAIATKYENSFLRDGDLVFADTAEDTTTGKCIELRDTRNNHVLAGLHTMPCRPRRTFSCGFLGYCLSSQVYRKQLIPLMQGIKVISISRTALQQTVIPIPQIEEQDRIGKLFLVLDSLIAAVKHKIELLELKKRALLQQMFV